jgi:hypothetical protein
VIALWKYINEKGIKVDVLINNAGRGGAHAKIGEGDVDEWWRVQVCTPTSENKTLKLCKS